MPPLSPTQAQPTSYHDVLQQKFQIAFEDSNYQPFVWPYRAIGPNLLLFYLLLPPTKSKLIYYLRYLVFAAIVYFSVESLIQCRSPMVTTGYGIGLLNIYVILWSATLIIFNDARSDFKRIEAHRKLGDAKWKAGVGTQANGPTTTNTQFSSDTVNTSREESLGSAILRAGHIKAADDQNASSEGQAAKADDDNQYVWQRLPPVFQHRLDWVTELICSFRGPRWSYRISGLTPPPPHIQVSLEDKSLIPANQESHLTRPGLLRQNLPPFLFGLLVLDGLKTLAMQDPYFWSLGTASPSPFPYPRFSRMLITVPFVFFSLQSICLLSPLVFGVLLGPERIGEHSWPWMYTPFFGSIREISKHGLAGAWGRWWHQLFRLSFEQGGEFFARALGGEARGWGKKSQKGLILRVFTAFTLSGILHAAASYTTMPPTKPLHSFVFFAMQPLGLLGQRAFTDWIRKAGYREKIPQWLREAGNVLVVVAWVFATGPIVADDFAATGIWLYEPVPFSIFRGLTGQGWWFWGGTWARWHKASPWWKSGIAF